MFMNKDGWSEPNGCQNAMFVTSSCCLGRKNMPLITDYKRACLLMGMLKNQGWPNGFGDRQRLVIAGEGLMGEG